LAAKCGCFVADMGRVLGGMSVALYSRAMAKKKVSDFLVERLTEWGVSLVYGYAGDGINGILGALGRASDGPRLIQPPHEELCALMATAHAKYSGKVGVCLVTHGPGAVHALNGLYDAKLDHQPVVAILGQVSQAAGGYAELLGLEAVRVASVEALQAAFQTAFTAERPLLIEAITDPKATRQAAAGVRLRRCRSAGRATPSRTTPGAWLSGERRLLCSVATRGVVLK
jgi:thiamine pyrophosphate-dependent acetolactate synthase large subunit-like protein